MRPVLASVIMATATVITIWAAHVVLIVAGLFWEKP